MQKKRRAGSNPQQAASGGGSTMLLLVGAAATIAQMCTIMQKGTCWSNSEGKITHVSTVVAKNATGADVCCPECQKHADCVAWTYIPVRDNKKPGCDLYRNNGFTKQSSDGCASGAYPKVAPTPAPAATGIHNILFIIDESTDSRAYFFGHGKQRDESPVQLPNLARLMKEGTVFNHTYAHVPVCCPSRTTIAAGRYAHRIPHMQINPSTGLHVNGTWNNHEGLDKDYEKRYDQLLEKIGGYNVKIVGKTDWDTGKHSVDCKVQSWLEKVPFPYTLVNHSAGWPQESGPICGGDNSTANETHPGDWQYTAEVAAFIRNEGQLVKDFIRHEGKSDPRPWYVHLGTNIVHPSYTTSKVVNHKYWLDKIDESKITIPVWMPLEDMHPEDFQQTMKKHMASDIPLQNDKYNLSGSMDKWKLLVRRHYYAMIAEYDSMVGEILQAVEDSGQWDMTWIFATSDHGDMNMEHRQYYKMTHWDASSRVPLIIKAPMSFAPYSQQQGIVVHTPISTLDFFPTILDMANISAHLDIRTWEDLSLDGRSLMPFLATGEDKSYPECVLVQFHGEEIHLSWFMVRCGDMKYVTYGSGQEVPARLFNITRDDEELDDLVNTSLHLPLYDCTPGDLADSFDSLSMAKAKTYGDLADELDAKMRKMIDYPAVAEDVESYNKESFVRWRSTLDDKTYKKTMAKLRWANWNYNETGNYVEIEKWLKTPNSTFHWACDPKQHPQRP